MQATILISGYMDMSYGVRHALNMQTFIDTATGLDLR